MTAKERSTTTIGWFLCQFGFALILTVLLGSQPSLAQTGLTAVTGSQAEATPESVKLPEELTPETIRELVSTLSDQQVRELLLQRLDAVAASGNTETAGGGGNAFTYLTQSLIGVGVSVGEAVVRVPQIYDALATGLANFAKPRGFSGIMLLIASVVGAIAGGLVVEMAVTRIASRWRNQIQQMDKPDGLKQTIELLGKRLLLDIAGLLAFFAVTRVLVLVLVPETDQRIVDLFMLGIVVFPRAGAALGRFLLAPNSPNLRLMYADDWTAKFLYYNQNGIIFFAGFSNALLVFLYLNGVQLGESRLGFWLFLITFIWIGYTVYRARYGLTSMLIGGENEATQAEKFVAKVYPWFAMVLVGLTWMLVEIIAAQGRFDLLADGQQYITLFALLCAPVLDTTVRGLVKHLVPPMRGEGLVAEAAYNSTKRSYVRIGRALVVAAVIIVIAKIWGIDFRNLASAGLGARIAGTLFENLFILAIGYLVWELVTLWLNRKLADEQTAAGIDLESEEPGGGEGGGAGGSRLSTVLPLIKLCAQVTIVTLTVLVALGNLGVDITPLLAGAGIVGLAIGFGAQTLVRDVVAGLFFLVDDAFRVGEYLDIDGTVGTVEKISVRSLQLRHHQGPVHTIPYGEIPKVTNNSRDWVIVKLKFTVPFDTDANKVKKLFKQIGKEIMDAPYAEDIIQTFKSQGVYDVNDVGIVVRGKFMAKPGKQWMIRKDVYSRVQKIFAENGIEFARREVRVNIPEREDGKEGGEQVDSAVAAAASQAVIDEQQRLEAEAAPAKP
ncbi:MAG: mechanosensitive ion channel family protein [Alphaproteobacteria bacterium]|nr:mechanosensitive ion channel family protein [Alphaproteobacteria bacterium]